MECMWYITPLLLVTVVSADYCIDNANTSVVYSMPPSQSEGWEAFSVGTQSLALSFSNSTGNYTIPLDASHCYDQNYALGVCGTADNCFVQMPFRGSGITMYVFNAGVSGMTASFSVDGGPAVSNTIQAPPPPTYQVSNVSLYNIQGLPTGNHTITMTLLDWNGGDTSMKFDYAYVNETFVASSTSPSSMASTTTSQTSSQTPTQMSAGNPTTSNKVDGIVGATLGGLGLLIGLVIGFLHLRKRKATPQNASFPESILQVNPFTSEPGSPTPPSARYTYQRSFSPQHRDWEEATPSISPLARTAILRDALAAGSYYPSTRADQSARSDLSGQGQTVLQPLRRPPSQSEDVHAPSRVSRAADADAGLPSPSPSPSPLLDPQIALRYDLTVEQVELVNLLRQGDVPPDVIARIIEGCASSNLSGGPSGSHDRRVGRERSFVSVAPPSYQTRGD